MSDRAVTQLHAMLRTNGAARYLCAPAMTTGNGAEGVQLQCGAGAYGAYADLSAVNAITTEFWIAGLSCYTTDGAQVFQLQLFDMIATRADFEFQVTAPTLNIPPQYVPIPLYCPANTEIQGRAGGAANKTINARLHYLVGI